MSRSILIVVQNASHRASLELVVRSAGDVLSVDSGEAALVHLGMTDFGCVIVGSPVAVDFDGERSTILELFERMAPNLASRVVVVTSADASAVIRRALELNVFAIFIVPFDDAELLEAVQRCLLHKPPLQQFHGSPDILKRLDSVRPPDRRFR